MQAILIVRKHNNIINKNYNEFFCAVVAALYHDIGFVKNKDFDPVEGTGAQFINVHVSRGCSFMHENFEDILTEKERHRICSLIDVTDYFKKGKNFKCFELNGVMGYDLRITNNKKFEIEEFKLSLRWILVRMLTGSINLLTCNALYYDIIKSYYPSLINFRKCKDYEKLFESCTA